MAATETNNNNNDLIMFFIIFLIGLFGLIFSIISLIIVYKKVILHNAFGYICAAHTLTEAGILFCFTFWSAPIILINPSSSTGLAGVIIGKLLNYFYYGANVFQLIKSANRFFATTYPIKYRILFSIKNAKIIITIVGILSVFLISPFYLYDCNFLFHPETYVWKVRNNSCEILFTIVDLSFTATTLMVSFIFDVITFIQLRFFKSSTQNLQRDIRFFSQTCITTALYAQIFIGFDILFPFANTTWTVFLSRTVMWQSAHAANQFSFVVFNALIFPDKMKVVSITKGSR